MRRYLLTRLLWVVPMLFCISILSFAVMNLAPGDPSEMFVPPSKVELTQEERASIRERLGLNQSIISRYFNWLGEILHGNFGYSIRTTRPVLTEIKERLLNTIILQLSSISISLLLGISVGIYGALHKNRLSDHVISFFTLAGISLPSVWVALLAVFLFSNVLGWFPSQGVRDLHLVNPTFWESLWDRIAHLVLPIAVSSLSSIAGWARYQRAAFLEVLHMDYIRTARAKGLTEREINWRHALKNSALPLVTMIGGILPGLFGGSILIERVFSYPGIGLLSITSITTRDYPMIMGTLFFSSALVLFGILISDILYCLVDPRIRY